MAAAASIAAAASKKSQPAEPATAGPTAFHATGMIMDCSDYLLMGKTPLDHREVQLKNIDAGMPACFMDTADGQVYLLVDLAGQAKEKFQPTGTWISEGVELDGVLYERGGMKSLAINEVKRTGVFTDRESRRKNNPQPNKTAGPTKPPKTPDSGGIQP
jgi:hypothetical protein